jgi:hypothetical protein
MYPNSNIWVNSPSKVRSLNAVNTKDVIPLKSEVLINTKSVYKYFTKKNFISNQDYEIRPDTKELSKFNTLNYTINIKSSKYLSSLSWVNKPYFKDYSIRPADLQFEQSGDLTFNLQTNQNPDDYLVLVRVTNITEPDDISVFILKPFKNINTPEPFSSSISFGYDTCQKLFKFKENDEILVKFDLISHDGNITPWTDNPIKVSVKKYSEQHSNPVKELNWYQKIFSSLSNFISSLFN